jgi:hypothetical protein
MSIAVLLILWLVVFVGYIIQLALFEYLTRFRVDLPKGAPPPLLRGRWHALNPSSYSARGRRLLGPYLVYVVLWMLLFGYVVIATLRGPGR